MTELSFHGIHTSRLKKAKSVTHVSGTKCHLCLGPLWRRNAHHRPSSLTRCFALRFLWIDTWELHRDGHFQPVRFSAPVYLSEEAARASGNEVRTVHLAH